VETWRPSFVQRSPQLDGLRGIAILLVFVNHVLSGVAPHDRPLIPGLWNPVTGGGYLGVQLFFVLSGFLITTILLAEWQRTGGISLKNFYLRRVRRLVPALGLALLAYGIYAAVRLHGHELKAALGSIARAATYTTNLEPVLPRWADSKWLQHTWSLSVEEQFYLTWPLVIIVVARRGRRALLGAAITGAVLTLALRFAADAAFVAYKAHLVNYLILRFDAIFIGCALAIAGARVPRAVLWLGIAVFALYTVRGWAQFSPIDYTITSLAGGAVLLAALHSRWIANRFLIFFGQISYGLYIWHMVLLRLDAPTWLTASASIGVAYLSYRYFELRFLRRRDTK